MKHGDFTGLAADYARYRPGYSKSVLDALLALTGKAAAQVDAVDVGAGTGIWTAMLASCGCRSLVAVEPNDDMRAAGIEVTRGRNIQWRAGSGEATGLPAQSADLLSMASSFHWVDFDRGTAEFARVLRPGGRFVALWNPRMVEGNPLLVEIEAQLQVLCPTMQRKSSGRSGITEKLTNLLVAHPAFEDLVYLEGRHARFQTVEQYLGTWRSVNDIQVQLGPEKFAAFLAYVERRLHGLPGIETTYLTRAWCARRTAARP
jgi:ubiquinone/menaquinone biosynthesis C-methylase UbiE